jgi:hypothetical protein
MTATHAKAMTRFNSFFINGSSLNSLARTTNAGKAHARSPASPREAASLAYNLWINSKSTFVKEQFKKVDFGFLGKPLTASIMRHTLNNFKRK